MGDNVQDTSVIKLLPSLNSEVKFSFEPIMEVFQPFTHNGFVSLTTYDEHYMMVSR